MSLHGRVSLMRKLRWGAELCLHWSGIGFWYSKIRPGGAVILMYHSVVTPGLSRFIDPRVRMDVASFERQVRMLARSRRMLCMGELAQYLKKGCPPPRSVAITFDDGYLDTLTIAAPILAHYGVPATLYLPTEYISQREPQWVDRLHHAFERRTRDELTLPSGTLLDLSAPEERLRARDALECELMSLTMPARTELLTEVEAQLKPEGKLPLLTMSWDDVRALVRRYPNLELGIHTAEHTDITARPIAEVRSELLRAQATAKRELGVALRHFSFPYSRDDALTRKLVRELGYETAVGSGGQFLIDKNSDPHHLPRIEPRADTGTALLSYWTSGSYPALPQLLFGRA